MSFLSPPASPPGRTRVQVAEVDVVDLEREHALLHLRHEEQVVDELHQPHGVP
jgi:hypothetical protein